MADPADVVVDLKSENKARERSLIPVDKRGLIDPQNFAQFLELAHAMAHSKEAVPAHFRGNVGMCSAVYEMAAEWGFRAYGVANLCYVVNNRMGFQAELHLAVINKHAGLKHRLRPLYEGEGDARVCIVRGHFEGEADPCEYRSPPIGNIFPKNSPLWKTDPDQQLFYYSARAFSRRFCSHVFLGIFGEDELRDIPHIGADHAIDVTPGSGGVTPGEELMKRLQAQQPRRPEMDTAAEIEAANGQEEKTPAPKRRRRPPERPQEAAGEAQADPPTEAAPAPESEPAPAPGPPAAEPPETPQAPAGGAPGAPPAAATGTPPAEPAAPAPAPGPPAPRSAAEYLRHAKAWMDAWQGTPAELEAMFRQEKNVRTTCGVIGEDYDALMAIKASALARLRSGG